MAVERTQVTNACLEEPRSGRNLSPKRGGGDRREGQKVTDTRTTAHYNRRITHGPGMVASVSTCDTCGCLCCLQRRLASYQTTDTHHTNHNHTTTSGLDYDRMRLEHDAHMSRLRSGSLPPVATCLPPPSGPSTPSFLCGGTPQVHERDHAGETIEALARVQVALSSAKVESRSTRIAHHGATITGGHEHAHPHE